MFPGWFVVQSITFTCGKIVFFFSSKGTSVTHRNIQTATISSKILLWPLAEACKVEATVYKSIQLENPRAIVFEISSYRNNISHASLLIKSGSAGLRLHTSDAQIVGGDCEILDDKQPSIVHLGAISPNSKVEIKVPYRVEGDMKEVIVRSELSYNVHGCTFVHGSNHRLAIQLPLGVNVQDIFKKNVLFSKFSISTSSEVPIRIAKCSLNGNDMYEVSTPYIDGSDFVVFPKQPLSLVYRIDKMHKTVARKGSKKLSLQIDYQCLDEQVVDTVCNHFTLALKESGFGTYDTLLQSRFKEFLKENQKQDLERVGLLDEIKVPSYVELEWDGILTILPLDIRTRLTSWLREWHKKNIALTVQQEGQRKIRHIEIPMEIPSVPVLHTVSLVVESRSPSRPYTVGEVITGELHITLTRCWSTDENKPSDSSPFIYEIEASPEIWLVAGQRRAYFTACEGEMKKFPIMLLPLRAGKLMLPGIEVRPAIDDEIDGRNKCETDYQSLGTAIEVVPGITGVSLDIATSSSGGLDGEVKVLEVERGGRAVA